MPSVREVSKRTGVFWRYIRAVGGRGVALWVGPVVTIGVWIVEFAVGQKWLGKAEWWLHPTPWFYALVLLLGLAIAQFLAWRDMEKERDAARLETEQNRKALEQKRDIAIPEIDERLELIRERSDPDMAMVTRGRPWERPKPDVVLQVLELNFRTAVPLDRPLITIKCSAPITRIISSRYNPETEKAMGFARPIRTLRFDRATVSFGNEPLPARSELTMTVYTPTLARLISAKVGGMDD